jgi:hypothetical protein
MFPVPLIGGCCGFPAAGLRPKVAKFTLLPNRLAFFNVFHYFHSEKAAISKNR